MACRQEQRPHAPLIPRATPPPSPAPRRRSPASLARTYGCLLRSIETAAAVAPCPRSSVPAASSPAVPETSRRSPEHTEPTVAPGRRPNRPRPSQPPSHPVRLHRCRRGDPARTPRPQGPSLTPQALVLPLGSLHGASPSSSASAALQLPTWRAPVGASARLPTRQEAAAVRIGVDARQNRHHLLPGAPRHRSPVQADTACSKPLLLCFLPSRGPHPQTSASPARPSCALTSSVDRAGPSSRCLAPRPSHGLARPASTNRAKPASPSYVAKCGDSFDYTCSSSSWIQCSS